MALRRKTTIPFFLFPPKDVEEFIKFMDNVRSILAPGDCFDWFPKPFPPFAGKHAEMQSGTMRGAKIALRVIVVFVVVVFVVAPESRFRRDAACNE